MSQQKINIKNYRINGEIFVENSPTVRLITPDGQSTICHISKAREAAREANMDLIEISPTANPPVLKIADYSKMIYELKKNAKKQQHSSKPLKEVQLSVSIAENDLKTKAGKAKEFILDGSKVKVVLSMKGREKARREENKKSIYKFITLLEDVAVPESLPKDEGDSKTIVILKKKQTVK